MNQVRCFNCGNICVKNGKTKAGTQRWLCKECSDTFTNPIDNSTFVVMKDMCLDGIYAAIRIPEHGMH